MKTARAKERAGVSARAREMRNVSEGSGEKSARASGSKVGPPERACVRCSHAVKPGTNAPAYHVSAQDGSTPVAPPRTTDSRLESLAALAAWFWGNVDRTRDCWLWRGSGGYGRVYLGGGHRAPLQISPHRLAWMLTAGSIPEGLVICHACDVPNCVRLSHLFLGTQRDNIRDAARKGRLIPPRGERNGRAKLSEAQAQMISGDIARGLRTGVIAARYDISPPVVSMIRHGQRWKHIRKGARTA